MNIIRGLAPAISEFSDLEQKLITRVANKIENNGFPIDLITRVHLKNKIQNDKNYYSENEITFFINPGVYKQDQFNWGIETISIRWEDPKVVRTPEGGIEFEVGRRIKVENLEMNLYGMQDSYVNGKFLKNHDTIIKRINDVLVVSELEDLKYFASRGIPELLKNYLIVINSSNEGENTFEMTIRRMDSDFIDPSCSEVVKQYHLKINLKTYTIKVLDSFYPGFYPSPVSAPSIPSIKKKG
ncbi:hypothetical protein [Aquimarina sediminis]|uniref:hypothetical protein n=1 Tax=Aquimarina sediminis TaxID=2070536 RepID=UPI000FFF3BB1|nr:hypothetical protein [Aquimarina sediminis]